MAHSSYLVYCIIETLSVLFKTQLCGVDFVIALFLKIRVLKFNAPAADVPKRWGLWRKDSLGFQEWISDSQKGWREGAWVFFFFFPALPQGGGGTLGGHWI